MPRDNQNPGVFLADEPTVHINRPRTPNAEPLAEDYDADHLRDFFMHTVEYFLHIRPFRTPQDEDHFRELLDMADILGIITHEEAQPILQEYAANPLQP